MKPFPIQSHLHIIETVCMHVCVCACAHTHACLITQLCLTLCDCLDYSPPGASVHEISQARILVWVAISFSRGSSQPRGWTQVSRIAGEFFTNWATRDPRILEWVAYPFSSRSSRPRNQTGSPALQADSLPTELSEKPILIFVKYDANYFFKLHYKLYSMVLTQNRFRVQWNKIENL